jgi:phosphate transport system protein
MWGLTQRSADLCTAVIEDDLRVNELQRLVRENSFSILLRETPVATDLREVMSLIHISAELERMGDHCVSIAKLARVLVDIVPPQSDVDLVPMADLCASQVREIISAVVARDVDRARQIAGRDDRVDRVYHRIFDELLQRMIADGDYVYRGTNLVFIAHHLERISDRVTNIAEDLVFLESGVIEELG